MKSDPKRRQKNPFPKKYLPGAQLPFVCAWIRLSSSSSRRRKAWFNLQLFGQTKKKRRPARRRVCAPFSVAIIDYYSYTNVTDLGQTQKRGDPRVAAFVHRCALFVWLAVLEGMISSVILHPAPPKKYPYRHFCLHHGTCIHVMFILCAHIDTHAYTTPTPTHTHLHTNVYIPVGASCPAWAVV